MCLCGVLNMWEGKTRRRSLMGGEERRHGPKSASPGGVSRLRSAGATPSSGLFKKKIFKNCINFLLAIPAIMIFMTMRASRPPDIKVGDAACKFPLLLGFLLQPAVVRLGHSCIINAQFQPMKPQTYSPCLDFYSTKRNIFWRAKVRLLLPSRAPDCR